MGFDGFDPAFFGFFRDLARNNERTWFEENKERYRDCVLAPMQDFAIALAPKLEKISPHFRSDPRRQGGSIFRIHRDTRFSKDKTPYKTHAAMHFRHATGRDAHAPGFYLHLAPDEVRIGAGVWMPAPDALFAIRTRIGERAGAWKKARDAASVKRAFGGLHDGDALSRAPRGFDPDHAMIEDIKKRSFFVIQESNEKEAGARDFVARVAKAYGDAAPFMAFLCEATGAPF